jgi:tRNA1(Val) A37 N6-methylase TrmN6
LDGFLGNRLTIAQPAEGFRAGHDSVLLAAAVPATDQSSVLELGAGAGVASLCLAARVRGARVLGIDNDPNMVELANENAARNAMADRVHFECADVKDVSRDKAFDHVFFNPPFHPANGQESPNQARARAMHDAMAAIAKWTRTALGLVRPGGSVTAILRADRGHEMLSAVENDGVIVLPLFPRADEPAKRIIVRIVKGSPKNTRVAAGLVLHDQDGRNTEAAEAVLRHGAALELI